MDDSKRCFLKIAGASVVAAVGSGWSMLPPSTPQGASMAKGPKALKARRWGMVIDTKKCLEREGCRACIEACHRTHNVPKIDNPEEEVKWIWKEEFPKAFPNQAHSRLPEPLAGGPVLVLCNHCVNPPCVRVCPTQATWKREEDGLVLMDEHRCIGCRYCMAACPYGSRSFNWQDPKPILGESVNRNYPTRTKGVVEKCNFCAERLAAGQLPACVEACRKQTGRGALVFGDLEQADSEVSQLLSERFSIRRKPGLGTEPQIYYLV